MDAYERPKIYKGRIDKSYEKSINIREFWEGDLVHLFNSRLKLFFCKLHSQWWGPFKVLKAQPYGAIEIGTIATGSFKVNDSRLKQYIAGKSTKGKVSCDLTYASSTWKLTKIKLGT